MTQEALKLAEIIEHFDSNDESLPLELLKEISATLRALAQTQEPVAWQFFQGGKWHNGMEFHDHRKHTIAAGTPVRDLYATPPQRTWVGLTDEELADCMDMSIQKTCRAIEAKLKEKNMKK